jgi:large subunit ribosomal protein L18
MKRKINSRKIRHKRLRAKIKGTANCPRLSVFRSNSHIYAQMIDDENGKTLFSSSDFELKSKSKGAGKMEDSKSVGKLMAKKAAEKKIEAVVFDRGGYKYHGKVKAIAEGAREGGLKF